MNIKFRIFNICFAIGCILYAIAFGIYVIVVGNYTRLFACAGLVLLSVAPFLLEKIFKFRMSNFAMIFLMAYVLLACGFGSMLGAYSRLGHLYYDKIIHGLFGYVGSVGALYMLCQLGDYSKVKAVTAVLFCFGIAMALGAMWEIYEFGGSVFFDMYPQGSPDSAGFVPVNDTMGDIIANTTGGLIFVLQFSLHRATNKNLLMGSMIKEFLFKYPVKISDKAMDKPTDNTVDNSGGGY